MSFTSKPTKSTPKPASPKNSAKPRTTTSTKAGKKAVTPMTRKKGSPPTRSDHCFSARGAPFMFNSVLPINKKLLIKKLPMLVMMC